MKAFLDPVARFMLGLVRPSKLRNLRGLREREESLGSFTFREAERQDLSALAALHVKTWSDTFPWVKRPPTYEIREGQWSARFDRREEGWFCFVIERADGELVGFAQGNAYDDPEFSGQLNKIYLLREYQRLGFGRRLIGLATRRFLEQGVSSMLLFGDIGNPSNAFYEALGAERIYSEKGEFQGAYGWRNLEQLAEACPVE